MPTVHNNHRLAAATPVAAAVLLFATPAASADKPVRIEVPPFGFVIPAGEGCADFDVYAQGVHHTRIAETSFPDGREVTNASATITLTNMETGQTYTQLSRYMARWTIDPDTGDVVGENHGRMFITFWPGDVGPDGSVVTENMMLSVVGHQTYTIDAETGGFTSYRLDGAVLTDLCAALSA